MSEQNVRVVHGMWEAFLRNDFEADLSAYRKGFSDADEALDVAGLL
jgi:hypothetical protein